jgi:hypothetical protein
MNADGKEKKEDGSEVGELVRVICVHKRHLRLREVLTADYADERRWERKPVGEPMNSGSPFLLICARLRNLRLIISAVLQ